MAFRAAAVFLGLAGVAANQIEDSFAQKVQVTTLREASEAEYVKFNLKGESAEEDFPVGKVIYMKADTGPEAGAFLKGNIVKKGTEANTYDLHLWVSSVRQRDRLNVPASMILDAKPIDEKEAAEGAAQAKREEEALELARRNSEMQEQVMKEEAKARREKEEAARQAYFEAEAEANRKKAVEADARRQEEARAKAEKDAAALAEQQAEQQKLEAEAKLKAEKAEEQEKATQAAKQAQEAEERRKAEETLAKRRALRAKYDKVKAARKAQMAAQMSSMTDEEMRLKLWKDAQMQKGGLKIKLATGPDAEEVNRIRYIKVAKAVHDRKIAKAQGTLPKPNPDEPPIQVRVADVTTGKVLDMNIQRRMPMRTFMRIAAEHLGLDRDTAKFWRKGSKVNPNDTPMKLDIQNGETISVHAPASEATKRHPLRKRQ